jgi:hypothetical protein
LGTSKKNLVTVAVRPIHKGEEIFVSYNFGVGEESPDWYRRQYEAVADEVGLSEPLLQKKCSKQLH